MSTPTTYARRLYERRTAPAAYDPGWVNTELGNVQRSIPPWKSRTAMGNDTPSATDSLVLYDATHGPIIVTLSPPGQVHDLRLILKKIDGSAFTVTINGDIEGATSTVLTTQYQSITIQSNGLHYFILATT